MKHKLESRLPGEIPITSDIQMTPTLYGTTDCSYWERSVSRLYIVTFFIVQLSHPYMTTGKTVALTRQTFVSKVMSLLFNMLSRFVITFLPRSKRLLISGQQSPPTVILEPKKIKSATVSIVSPSICHEVMGPGESAALKMPANLENSAVATGLEKVSFQMPKNVQTTTQLHSSHTLVK